MEAKNKPEKHVKFGGIRVSIWKDFRKSAGGGQFVSRSVTLDRAYKDGNGQWQNTGSLRENDVPKAITALQKAFEYMNERNESEEGD